MMPDMLQSAVYEGITQTNDIAWSIKNTVMNGSYQDFEKMYRWAKKPYNADPSKSGYWYGLPDTQIIRLSDGIEAMRKHLVATHPGCTVDYVRYRPKNAHHEAFRWLTSGKYQGRKVDYSHVSNLAIGLSEYNGTPVWVKSITAVINQTNNPDEAAEKGGADTWQSAPTQFLYDKIDAKTGKPFPIDLSGYTFIENPDFPSFFNPYNENADANGWVHPEKGNKNEVEYIYPNGLSLNEKGVPAQLQVKFGPNEVDSFEVEFVYNHPTEGYWSPAKPIPPAVADKNNPPLWYAKQVTFKYTKNLVDNEDIQRGSNDTEYYQYRLSLPTKSLWDEPEKLYGTYSPIFDKYIPSVDSVLTPTNSRGQYFNEGTYFPILPFISKGKNVAQEGSDNTQFDSCTRLADYLGIDYYEMGQQISNPDVGGESDDFDPSVIEQSVMLMAVPLGSRNNDDMLYLFDYFIDLYSKVPSNAKSGEYNFYEDDYNYYPADGGDMANIDESIGISIADSDYKTIFSFDNISVVVQQGILVPHEDDDESNWVVLTPAEAIEQKIEGIVGTCQNENYTRSSPETWHTNPPSTSRDRILRKQLASTTFVQIRITNPAQRYDVYEGYSVISTGDDPKLLIMLDYNIARKFTPFERERLYARSLHVIFTTHQIQKTKWYEQGWFATVLVIVGIVLIIANVPGGWMVVAAALGGSVAAMIIVISWVMISILAGLAVSYAAQQLIEFMGIEAGIILTVIVVAVAIYASGGLEASSWINTVMEMTAENMLTIVNGLTEAIQGELLSETLETLGKFDELYELQGEYEEEFDRVEAILNTDTNLANAEDYIGLQPFFYAGEDPTAFLTRSCHIGNPGVQSLEIIENYVSTSLKLPELADSYGDFQ